jgi:cobalamin-dependent methionine synthase I
MDGSGIPDTAEKRLRVAASIIERATRAGIALEDVIIDPLAMSMGSDSRAGKVVLDTIMLVTIVNSTCQCNRLFEEYLKRCFESKTFAWSKI